jgi:hypothetical protein
VPLVRGAHRGREHLPEHAAEQRVAGEPDVALHRRVDRHDPELGVEREVPVRHRLEHARRPGPLGLGQAPRFLGLLGLLLQVCGRGLQLLALHLELGRILLQLPVRQLDLELLVSEPGVGGLECRPRVLALAEQPLDLAPGAHLVGDVDGEVEDPRDAPVHVAHGVVAEVEPGISGPTPRRS